MTQHATTIRNRANPPRIRTGMSFLPVINSRNPKRRKNPEKDVTANVAIFLILACKLGKNKCEPSIYANIRPLVKAITLTKKKGVRPPLGFLTPYRFHSLPGIVQGRGDYHDRID